ncbi:MAG: type II toxin-antitoxin system VapB family antitoxin [Clostridiales Family XIII bacterium]|nr:type II toxin-antitoxin system VapB family antitoxin [Clostridiales Family XIII bacterium]
MDGMKTVDGVVRTHYNTHMEVYHMRTNIDIDDNLMQMALKVTGIATKKEVVDRALRLYVAHHSRKDLWDIKGKIEFADGYDYKAVRERFFHDPD